MNIECPCPTKIFVDLLLEYRLVDFEPGPVQGPNPKLKEGPNQKSKELSLELVTPLFLVLLLIVVLLAM